MDESYRNELARDVLLALVSSRHWCEAMSMAAKAAGVGDAAPAPGYAALAVSFADALVAELNRQEPA